MNGTQLAACCSYGSVTAWSYPRGEILFQSVLFQREVQEWMDEIKWNPFRQDVFATRHGVKKRREFFVPSHFPTFSESFCLEAGKRFQFLQLFNQLLSLFLFRIFSGLQQIVSVEYASERRRHKGKSVSHIRTQYRDKNRVDFCKSNRSRVGQRSRY